MKRSALVPLLLLAATGAATAAPAAYYHPDSVAEQSALFAESATKAGDAFDRAQQEVGKLGRALTELEIGVAILGADAPPALQQWSQETRKQGMGQFLVVQRFVDAIQTDYSGSFEAALKRALPAVAGADKGGVAVCKASGPRMGPGGGGASRSCEGKDLNAALAKAIDADATLKAALDEIMSRPWPAVSLVATPQPAVALTGTERWISSSALADRFLRARIQERTERLEDGQSALEEEIDAGDAAAIAKANTMKEAWLNGLGEDGAALRAAAAEALTRAQKKGSAPTAIGVCANPAAFGGCPGEDVTDTVLDTLATDKKLVRALEAHLREHPLSEDGAP